MKIEDIFTQDNETGLIYKQWRVVGTLNRSSLVKSTNFELAFENKKRQVSHIAWYLNFGEFPTKPLFHKNGILVDTRISNLTYDHCFLNKNKFNLTKSTGQKFFDGRWVKVFREDNRFKRLERFMRMVLEDDGYNTPQ